MATDDFFRARLDQMIDGSGQTGGDYSETSLNRRGGG